MDIDLKPRFVVSIIFVFVVTAAVAYGALAWIAEDIVGTLGIGFVEKQVQFTRVQSQSPLLREVALARKMADSPVLRAWAGHESDPVLKRQAMAELESFRRAFRDGSFFAVVHKSGNYYFNDAKDSFRGTELRYVIDATKPADSWYFATIASDLDTQINVNHDANLQVTKVWVNVLMKDGDQVVGVLGTGIDLSSFIGDIVASGQDGIENIFVNEDGAIQAYRDVGKIDFASLTKAKGEMATIDRLIDDQDDRLRLSAAIRRLAEKGDGVETLFLKVGGRNLIVGLAPLKEIHWLAMTMVDLDLLMRQGRFLSIAVILGLALLAALGATGFLLDRLVLRRIGRLEESTRVVAVGDTELPLDHGPNDEIGRLSASFATMTEIVREQKAMLEEKVRIAVRDYEEANRRLAERSAELTRVNEELEEFAYVVSHDLRQPLRMVTSYLTLLERKLGGGLGKDGAGYLHYATDGARRMDRMVVGLLRYCRTGREGMEMAPVSLADVVADSVRCLDPMLAESMGEVTVAASLPVVMGNRDELERLFENLISNAVKYRHPERAPRITIDAQSDGALHVVQVSDNGIGIANHHFDRVFKVFQRLENSSAADGTGIGLAVCKKIMEGHHGEIFLESEEGVGTAFFLRFPGLMRHEESPS